MPVLHTFPFQANNDLVQKYLNQIERKDVTTWQKSDEWVFEFHTGHKTGNPIYVRPKGNKDTSNLPKFDTTNKEASDYSACSKLANGGKLIQQQKKGGLSKKDQEELESIITDSWDALSLLAKRYWSGTEAPAVDVQPTTKDCKDPNCQGQVPIVKSGKAACPVCYQYQ